MNSDRFPDVSSWLFAGFHKLIQLSRRFWYFTIDCQDNFDIFSKMIRATDISHTYDTDVFPVFPDRLLRVF